MKKQQVKWYATLLIFLLVNTANAQVVYDYNQAIAIAKETKKLVVLDFTATWCRPCADMDQQFWNNKDYSETVQKFVIAKIDIDYNKSIASQYGVDAIPHVKVINLDGEELFGFIGFKGASEVESSLKSFPANVGDLYENMVYKDSKKPTAEELLYVASSMQGLSQQLKGEAKSSFVSLSNNYFKKVLKAKPSADISEKATLGRAFNYLIANSPSKAQKEIELSKISQENKGLALYILARACAEQRETESAKKYLSDLESLNDANWSPAIKELQAKLK